MEKANEDTSGLGWHCFMFIVLILTDVYSLFTIWSWWASLSCWSIYQKRTVLKRFQQLLQHLEDEVVLSYAIHYSFKYVSGRWWHSTQRTASRFSPGMKYIAGEEANSLYTTTKHCRFKHSWAAGNGLEGMRSRVNLNLFIGKNT